MYKMTRRHVITTLSTSAVLLCPAILNAQTNVDEDWADIPDDTPIGQDRLIEVGSGPADVDVSELQPGEVAVIARPTDDEAYSATGMTQYIAVHRRTADQIAFGAANDRDGTVQNPEYFVVNLVCSHRGKAIGITGNPEAPFACTDRGDRHSSIYDASGFGVSGASEDEYLSIPTYTIAADGGQVVVSLT
ncbi:hypothetical protein BC777_3411 [Yoonia maricola]|uniref:Rieske domain-containing protein n=1 Tax=Yoonia maricola TaxID=420999 RepID=A0A2M8W3D4_9RHOB|nr:hypothetical protein [Yoonia maricola]PJI85409.1 hypothetical protein BC777_3411 [Yoonia maricola]